MKLDHLRKHLHSEVTISEIATRLGCTALEDDIIHTIRGWKERNQDYSSRYTNVDLLSQLSASRLHKNQLWGILTERGMKRGLRDKNLKYLEEILDLYETEIVMEQVQVDATLETLESLDCFGIKDRGISTAWKKAGHLSNLATIANSRNSHEERFKAQVKKVFKHNPLKAHLLNMILDRYQQKFGGQLVRKKFADPAWVGSATQLEHVLIEHYPGYQNGLSEYEAYHLSRINAPSIVEDDVKKKLGNFNIDQLFFGAKELASTE